MKRSDPYDKQWTDDEMRVALERFEATGGVEYWRQQREIAKAMQEKDGKTCH